MLFSHRKSSDIRPLHGIEGHPSVPWNPISSFTANPISVAEGIDQGRGLNASPSRDTVEQPTLPHDNESDADDGIRASVLSKMRGAEKKDELKQRIMILEQDKLQARENATVWKEKLYLLKKTFHLLQVKLSVKRKNEVERVARRQDEKETNFIDEPFRWRNRRNGISEHSCIRLCARQSSRLRA